MPHRGSPATQYMREYRLRTPEQGERRRTLYRASVALAAAHAAAFEVLVAVHESRLPAGTSGHRARDLAKRQAFLELRRMHPEEFENLVAHLPQR